MLISPEYAAINAEMHKAGSYGVSAPNYIAVIADLAQSIKAKSVLDYGSGANRWLEANLTPREMVRSYDPCVAGLDARPEPADLLVSIDVLEHVEPECLDAVLDDMQRCTGRFALMTVATVAARKTLPDGRNAHLTQQGSAWWLPKLMARWDLGTFRNMKNEFMVVMGAFR